MYHYDNIAHSLTIQIPGHTNLDALRQSPQCILFDTPMVFYKGSEGTARCTSMGQIAALKAATVTQFVPTDGQPLPLPDRYQLFAYALEPSYTQISYAEQCPTPLTNLEPNIWRLCRINATLTETTFTFAHIPSIAASQLHLVNLTIPHPIMHIKCEITCNHTQPPRYEEFDAQICQRAESTDLITTVKTYQNPDDKHLDSVCHINDTILLK